MTDRSVPALDVRGVTSGYGDTVVVRDVSMTVPRGEVVALLGPNGAGKTTLLRTISGLLPARRGSVTLDGRDVTKARPHARAGAGLCHIPEGRGVFPGLTVQENLVMQAAPGERAAALERAAAAFPVLGQRMRQRAGRLSGGQQQMLALAAAHVRPARVILVDETSLGLAPIIVDEIFAFLRRVAADGTAVLLVDQYADRVLELASTAYVLRKGGVVFHGAAAELQGSDLFSHYLGSTP